MDEIEPRIRPLVDALNQTGLVQTFSSCEGHYVPGRIDQPTPFPAGRQHAEVRFIPAPNVSLTQVEALLTAVLTRFKTRHGLLPVRVLAYKLYTPLDDETVDETFVLELRPFNRFDAPDRQRSDTDRAVEQVVRILERTTNSA